MSKRKAIHERVLNASSRKELMSAYEEWAEDYDHDLLDEMDYVAPVNASSLLADHLAGNRKQLRILDAGCGTGIVGELLKQKGFSNIEGLDYSEHMLAKAKEKNVYNSLHRGDLTGKLSIDSNSYNAVISVGTFTSGHVGPEALTELIRITRPGGFICFTVREQAWEEDGYREKLAALEAEQRWQLEEMLTADYIRQEGAKCRICLYTVLS